MHVLSVDDCEDSESSRIVLWWLPVGAGAPTRISQVTSGWWERLEAKRDQRAPQQLFHTALEVFTGTERFVIEVAPEWSDPHIRERGVIARGPVGIQWLGRSKLFRYEVRCWPNGELSDRSWAVGGPVTVSRSDDNVRALLQHIERAPVLTWGRTVHPTGDMWNSNSLVSWLLEMSGIDASKLHPPANGRAPGWDAGVALAQEERASRQIPQSV